MELTLKQRLKKGQVVIGPWCTIPSPHVAHILGSSGLDFIIIDREHGPMSFETASLMAMAAQATGCTPIIRVNKNDEAEILNALDCGAAGVVVPHIESAEDARRAVSFIKYPPVGIRGFSPYTPAANYVGGKDYTTKANEATLTVLIVEGLKGLDSLDTILATSKDIDVIYIGAYDLSQALGIPGDVHSPKVKQKIEAAVTKIRAAGIAAGSFVAKTEDDIKWLTSIGVQFITTWVDANLLHDSFEKISRLIKK